MSNKKETIEEAAANYANQELNNELTSKVGNFYSFSSSFIEGAEEQAKRMYTEKEVRKIVWESRLFFDDYENTPFSKMRKVFNKWFEQFKK